MNINSQIQNVLPAGFVVKVDENDFGLPESLYNFHKHVTVQIEANGNLLFHTSNDNFQLSTATLNAIKRAIDNGTVNVCFVTSNRIWGTNRHENDPFVPFFQGSQTYTFLFDRYMK
jgi:hypothetical protein